MQLEDKLSFEAVTRVLLVYGVLAEGEPPGQEDTERVHEDEAYPEAGFEVKR